MNIGDLVKANFKSADQSGPESVVPSGGIGLIIDIYEGEHGEEYFEVEIDGRFMWYSAYELRVISRSTSQ